MNIPLLFKKLTKSMIIAVAVVAMLSAVVGALVLNRPSDNLTTPTQTPEDFKMTANYPSYNVTQGYGCQISLSLETMGGNAQAANTSNVNVTAYSGTSGIKTELTQTTLLYNNSSNPTNQNATAIPIGFSSQLLLSVPKSTPTNNYNITVTAKIGSVSHNISILVGVESALVTLSGTIDSTNERGPINPTQIQFLDFSADSSGPEQIKYHADIQGNRYSITIPNHKTYIVSIYDWRVGYWDCDNDFWLNAPAGIASMAKDFTVFGHLRHYEMP